MCQQSLVGFRFGCGGFVGLVGQRSQTFVCRCGSVDGFDLRAQRLQRGVEHLQRLVGALDGGGDHLGTLSGGQLNQPPVGWGCPQVQSVAVAGLDQLDASPLGVAALRHRLAHSAGLHRHNAVVGVFGGERGEGVQRLVGALNGFALRVLELVAAFGPLLDRVRRAPEPAPLQQQTMGGARLVAQLCQRGRMIARAGDPLAAIMGSQRIRDTPVVSLGLDLPVTPNLTFHTIGQIQQR